MRIPDEFGRFILKELGPNPSEEEFEALLLRWAGKPVGGLVLTVVGKSPNGQAIFRIARTDQ